MFTGGIFKPVLAFPAVFIVTLLALIREPVGAFPSRQFAKDCAVLFQMFMERCAAYAPRSCLLTIGEVIGIEQPQGFFGPFTQVMFITLEWLHAADVHITQIKRFFARVHPLRQYHARAACGLDAD